MIDDIKPHNVSGCLSKENGRVFLLDFAKGAFLSLQSLFVKNPHSSVLDRDLGRGPWDPVLKASRVRSPPPALDQTER